MKYKKYKKKLLRMYIQGWLEYLDENQLISYRDERLLGNVIEEKIDNTDFHALSEIINYRERVRANGKKEVSET